MKESRKWSQFVIDEKTGKNFIVLTTLVNGIDVNDDIDDDEFENENTF